MAEAGTIEVPVTPKLTIPFSEREVMRVEMERVTVVAEDVCIKPRDCNVFVDGERLRGVQAVVVAELAEQRAAGVVIKTRSKEAIEDVDRLRGTSEAARYSFRLELCHPDTGEVVRSYELAECRLVAPTAIDGWARIDFVGRPVD